MSTPEVSLAPRIEAHSGCYGKSFLRREYFPPSSAGSAVCVGMAPFWQCPWHFCPFRWRPPLACPPLERPRRLAELASPPGQRMESSDGQVRGVVDTLVKVITALERA